MQDVFSSGAIKSATDFQIYEEVGRLPGLDFAYTDTTSVYHTKVGSIGLSLLMPILSKFFLFHIFMAPYRYKVVDKSSDILSIDNSLCISVFKNWSIFFYEASLND